jgi:hypothetical protein
MAEDVTAGSDIIVPDKPLKIFLKLTGKFGLGALTAM